MQRGCYIAAAVAWIAFLLAADAQTGRILLHLDPAGINAMLHGDPPGLDRLRAGLDLPSHARVREDPFREACRATGRDPAPGLHPERWFVVSVPPAEESTCLRRLRRHPWVCLAEPDGIGSGAGVPPNDPDFGMQWHHRNPGSIGTVRADIHSIEAWETTVGSTGVVLAILDTGLASNQTDFAGRILPGYDFANSDADPADDHGHGTAVAGAACATGNNAARVAGVDWRCRILPVKVLGADNTGFYSWWAAGIDWAVANGADVINLSAGGATSNTTLTAAIDNAIAQGVVFVTITHNDGSGIIRFPGRLPQCITVGATDADDVRTSFSNYGPAIDLVAPGTNIYTLSRTGTSTRWWGSSFAAPLAAGVASLLASVHPDLTQEQARTLLCAGADDQVGDGQDTAGFDPYYGHGRLNALASLQLARTRIATVSGMHDRVTLTWASPSNAVSKTPYRVEAGLGAWSPAPGTLTFSATQTTWTADGPGSVYRVRIQE